jgi:hypothetical protein
MDILLGKRRGRGIMSGLLVNFYLLGLMFIAFVLETGAV